MFLSSERPVEEQMPTTSEGGLAYERAQFCRLKTNMNEPAKALAKLHRSEHSTAC